MATQNTQAAEILADKVVDAAVDSAHLGDLSKATQKETKEAIVTSTELIVMNQLNQEPWYQSTILVTQYVGLLVTLLGVIGYSIAPEYRDAIVSVILGIGTLIVPVTTIYARLFKKKPLTLFTGTGKG